MIGTFVGLKLRLVRNALRASRQAALSFVGLCVFAAALVAIGLGILVEIEQENPAIHNPFVISAGAFLGLLWILVPLTIGYTDGTIDPARLAGVALSRPRLVSGLAAAALASPMPVFTFLLLCGPALTADSPAEVGYAVVAGAVGTVLFVVLSQVAAAAASALIRRRATRDLMAGVLTVLAVSAGLGVQFLSATLGLSAERWWTIARIARLTPGGWIGQGSVWADQGRWGLALSMLVLSGIVIVGLILAWAWLIDRLLTATPQATDAAPGRQAAEVTIRWLRWLPHPVDVTTSRALRSIRRDHREWIGIVTSVPLLLFAAIPLTRIEQGEATLFVSGVGTYLGLAFMALFAFDGAAVWLDLSAARSMRDVLAGKCLARLIVTAPLLPFAGVATALLTGGWRFVPTGVLLAFASLLAMAGVGALVSVRYAVPMPETANQFSGQAGQASSAFASLGAVFLGAIAVAPALAIVVVVSWWSWWVGLLIAPLAVAYGAWLGWQALRRAGATVDHEGPELLAKLTM